MADGPGRDTLAVTGIDAPPGYGNDLHTHPPNELFYVLDGEMYDRQRLGPLPPGE